MSAKKMGLGRGLNTLIPKAPIVDEEDVEQVKKKVSKSSKTKKKEETKKELTLPIDKIEPNPDQPRNQFDEDTLQELADSIKQYGMLQPILVTPKDDFYEIIAGERRWRAAKQAGLNEVPVMIRKYNENEIVEIALIENIQRDNLNPIEEAMAYKRLMEEFECKVSPLEIKYIKTGQTIYFRGLDDETKLKSIKPEFGYIGILWKEEKDQMKGDAQERSVNQSVLRGGDESYDFSSYNPPKSKSNWVNRIKLTPNPKRVIHHSSYLEAPAEWLGQKFIDDAAHLKEINPEAYEHEYLGVPNGDGGNVFEYLEIRNITDEEISRMDRIFAGVDYGWYPDQFCYLRTYYDSAREKIYLIDELYVNKWSNSKTADWIKKKGYDDYTMICDSAEPKSVNDFRDAGLPARGAIKGPGSIEYGFKFLQTKTLVIDPKRTPNAYKEITEYEYDRDKEGNVISGYPDGNDHAISALRYAYEPLFNRRGNSA